MNALKGYFEVIKLSIIRNDGTFALSVSLEIVQEPECEFELNTLPKGGDFTVLWHKACLSCSPNTVPQALPVLFFGSSGHREDTKHFSHENGPVLL